MVHWNEVKDRFDRADEGTLLDQITYVKETSGAFDLYRVSTFRGFKKNSRGEAVEFTVEVHRDRRGYYAKVLWDGQWTVGNTGADFEAAIRYVHWDELDK